VVGTRNNGEIKVQGKEINIHRLGSLDNSTGISASSLATLAPEKIWLEDDSVSLRIYSTGTSLASQQQTM